MGAAFPLASCAISLFVSVILVGFFGSNGNAGNVIWVANGMLLAYLLLAPRWRWRWYLLAGMAGMFAGSWAIHEPWKTNVFYNILNLIEILFPAFLLRRKSTQLPDFTEGSFLIRFLGFAVLGGPVLSGTINGILQVILWHRPGFPGMVTWVGADALGIVVACPIFAAILQTRRQEATGSRWDWMYTVFLVTITVVVFGQSKWPVLFLIYPALLMVLLRKGLGWAATSALFVAFAGGWFTLQGKGPLAGAGALPVAESGWLLQIFVAAGVFMIYSVSVVLESRRAMEQRLARIASIHELVSENSRDAIILADLHGRRSFVSAAVERLIGWSPQEFARVRSIELVHPEDLHKVEETVQAMRSGSEGATIECRVRKFTGEYIWVEASLRLVRDGKTGAPSGILNIVRDVTERKLSEQRLQEAYTIVEALAATDPLTGLANRRKFEEVLNNEWRRCVRDHSQLSMLMIDADHFKLFNDCYGHMKGDGCLKQIAAAAQDVVARPGDLVARFGGEEFAVILPGTDKAGAIQLASQICEAMRGKRIPHEASASGVVTVSIGCATIRPTFGLQAVKLIELADQALYDAKHRGRDMVCSRDGNES